MNSWHCSFQIFLLLLPLNQGFAKDEAAPATDTSWHELPIPEGQGGVTDIAVEQSGVLWSLFVNGACYWAGDGFQTPIGDALSSGYYLSKLIGGTDRDLYASQSGEIKREGKLYRLKEGTCEYVTDFRYDVAHETPGLYVSRWGHIYNWGENFLAVFVDGDWQRHRTKVGVTGVQVVESGDRVCILGQQPEKLFIFDKSGAMSEQEMKFGESVPLSKSPKIVAWSENRLLALSQEVRNIFAFDVVSGESIDIGDARRQLNDLGGIDPFRHYGGFARADGSVWLSTSLGDVYAFDRISSMGIVERVEGTSSTVWAGESGIRNPDIVLETRDGAVWIIPSDTTVIRFQAGRIKKFNWRDGLSAGTLLHLAGGGDGTVYAASSSSIVAWKPEAKNLVPEWTRFWEEYRLASHVPIRDSLGNVWMLLRDRPGEVSRWNGTAWHHQTVAFDTAKIYGGMADDQGHVLLSGSEQCHDVSPASVTTFADTKEAVVAAVARGVKRFETGKCLVDGKVIWLGDYNREEIHRYDGKRWDSVPLSRAFGNFLESPKHGVLIHDEGGDFFEYEGDRLRYVTGSGKHTRWLWSHSFFQPYESKLFDRRPKDFAIVQNGHLAVRVQEPGNDGAPKTTYLLGDMLPNYASSRTLTRGWRHGHWTDYGAAPIYRFLGQRVITCDWQRTPLHGRYYEIRQVLEDRVDNLWIRVGRQVFMKRMSDFKIQLVGAPKIVDGEVQLDVEPVESWHGDYEPLIFWRIDGGHWQGGEATSRITLQAQAECEIEVMGMDRQGGTSELLLHSLRAGDR